MLIRSEEKSILGFGSVDSSTAQSMIRESGYRFSEKIMLNQDPGRDDGSTQSHRALGNSKLLYREFRNLCSVFNAGLGDLEYRSGNNPRDRIVAIYELESTQSSVVRGDQALDIIRPHGGILDELVNGHSLYKRSAPRVCGHGNFVRGWELMK